MNSLNILLYVYVGTYCMYAHYACTVVGCVCRIRLAHHITLREAFSPEGYYS